METKLIHRFLCRQSFAIVKPLALLLVFLLSVLTTKAYCQEVSLSLGLSSNVQSNTIVRSYNDIEFVSYVETATQHLFLWVDQDSNIIYSAEIPMEFYVRDFEIYEDLAYFCGLINTGSHKHGIIGYFRINMYCTPGPKDIYVYDNIIFMDVDSTLILSREFTELEVFDKYAGTQWAGDSVFLVAVGEGQDDHCLVLEAIGEYDNPSNWRYTLGHNYYSYTKETLEQISVTSQYVVTSGIIYNDVKNGMGFRVFKKFGVHDMFSDPTIHDNVYRYFPQGNPIVPIPTIQYPLSHRFEMTALNKDSVATLSLYRLDNGGMPYTMYYGFLLNVYDITQTISTMNNPCAYSMGSPVSYYGGYIYDLRHDNKTYNLVAALSADVPSWGPQSVCAMIPYTQPLPITFDYNYTLPGPNFNKVVMHGMATSSYYTYLTSSNFSGTSLVSYHKYPCTTPSYIPQCLMQGQGTCDYPGDLSSKYDVEPLSIYRKNIFNFSQKTISCVDEVLNMPCFHKL